jgi:lipopolysaccharide export system permease protein
MKLLQRYIAKSVLASIALVTLMLAGLQVFILFVNQLGDIGKADYGIVTAAIYVLLEMPYEVYLFFPMASLLGCLIGLGVMANHRELVVMRASGMSIWQITRAVLNVAMFIIIIITLVGEIIMPKMVRLANDQKILALSGGQTLRTAKGVWLRYQNDFIAITSILSASHLLDIYQFHFDEIYQLRTVRHMDALDYNHGSWQARGIAETFIKKDKTKALHHSTMIWDVPLKPHILSVSGSEPDEMTLFQLNDYLRAQKKNRQSMVNYQLAYWQRIIQPFTTAVMMVLAIPFIFGPLRSSTMGSKLLTGAIIGFSFHIMNRFLGAISQVYQLSPILAAIGPTCLFVILGLYLMRRVK